LSTVADTSPDRPPILVLGEGITALGVIRILRRDGLRPLATQAGDVLVRQSRWFEPVAGGFGHITAAALADGLRALALDRAVLMPCSDAFAGAVAGLDPSLSSRFPASISAPETLALFTDKGRFADTLMELGIAHPWSGVVHGPADLARAPDRVFDHAMLKPRDSQSFFRHYRVKAVHVKSRQEAAEKLAAMSADGFSFVLQEYIPGSGSQHYFVDGFIDRGGTVRGLFVRRRLRMYPLDFGNSTYMVSTPVDEAAQAVESITSLLHRVGYRGVFSAEFKLDPRDQVFRLLEVNARPWWFVEFAARCGVDVCRMAYDDALGRPVATVDRYQVGRKLVFPYMDYQACLEARDRGELSMWQWVRSWFGAVQPVFMLNDPLPASAEFLRILTRTLKRRARALFMPRGKATRGQT
jgi:predicted ATP-grasp superfamily ATP-dependent carboligase